MWNEWLLLLSVGLIYGGVVCVFVLCGFQGLFVFGALAGVLANIEVLLLIKAFGIEQTLGNVLFASTFLLTDALSELKGKNQAKKAVRLNLFGSVLFLTLSQMWIVYQAQDTKIAEAFTLLFSQTPRIVIVSLLVFAIASYLDVWLYHRWWEFSTRLLSDKTRWLWLRNNGSTLISQAINTILFSFGAFWGVLEVEVIYQIIISSYLIFVILSLLDTPILYLLVYLSKTKKDYD